MIFTMQIGAYCR